MKTQPTATVHARLPSWLAVVLLGVFLAARGLVPAGFMPSVVSGGSLYQLCHGDSRSALLLSLATPAQHQHGHEGHAQPAPLHQHDKGTAQLFTDNHCSFSAASVSIVARAELHWSSLPGFIAPVPAAAIDLQQRDNYLTPPGRAPPIALILA